MSFARPTLVAACLLALGAGPTACGEEELGVDEPAREGLAIELGHVDYNVFITRQLNPDVPPDEAYYKGAPVGRDQALFGVFIQVCNNSSSGPPRQTAEHFEVVDNQGNTFEPTELPEENDFAYRPTQLSPKECIPRAGSVAQLGPSGGSMLLFQLPLAVTENRPLELEVEGPDAEKRTFELDI